MKRLLAFIICSCAVGSIFSQETDTLTTVPSQQHVTVWQQDETVVVPEKKKTHRLPNQHKVNVGFRAGFNSTMYQVSSLKISGITIDDVQNNYKIGYAGTLFMRFNIRKHFVQPEVSYTISRGEIEFDRLGKHGTDVEPQYAFLRSTIHSIDVPVYYGYSLVKEGPYNMSVFAGPKLKYIRTRKNDIEFENFGQQDVVEELRRFNLGMAAGVSVSISHIYFDFRYEQGFNNLTKSVTYTDATTTGGTSSGDISFKRRDNVLSFSLGVIF